MNDLIIVCGGNSSNYSFIIQVKLALKPVSDDLFLTICIDDRDKGLITGEFGRREDRYLPRDGVKTTFKNGLDGEPSLPD